MTVTNILLSVTALALLASAPSQANPIGRPAEQLSYVETIVHHHDLDLSSVADQKKLDARVHRAARKLCGQFNPLDLRMAAAAKVCHSVALKSARPQIDAAVQGARSQVDAAVADRKSRAKPLA